MSDEQISRDSLFIKIGTYFQAGASGRFAVVALVIIALAVIAARTFGAN